MKVHEILENEVGGKWTKCERMERWMSPDKPFAIYRSSETVDCTTKLVYRRSDTLEIVYAPYQRRCK